MGNLRPEPEIFEPNLRKAARELALLVLQDELYGAHAELKSHYEEGAPIEADERILEDIAAIERCIGLIKSSIRDDS